MSIDALEMESPLGPEIVLSGRRYLYFGGTGYHCLQGHPALREAATLAMERYGMGTGTRGTTPVGPSPVQRKLERTAARFFGTEDAVCFPSGYMANGVGIAGLARRYDRFFVDETSHYSVLDAVRIAGKPLSVFAHLDSDDLERRLRADLAPGEIPLLVSDGIFPTFGELAPVDEYRTVLEPYGGLLWLDDAHAVGVIGPSGRGTLDYFGESGDSVFYGGSLAKAIGGHGGVVPGTGEFCARVREASSFLKGSSGISIPAAAAATAGLEILLENPQLRTDLAENARAVKEAVRALGITIPESPQPVVAFSLETKEMNQRVHRELMARGIVVPYSQYVGAGDRGVLRIVVFSRHTEEQLSRLLDALRELIRGIEA